jgi:hypothetical protein
MKVGIRVAVFVCALAAIGCLSGVAAAQKVGGYKEIAKTDAGARAAAAFAVKAQTEKTEKKETLMSIFKAERQTVAGSNYRLCLKVTSEGGEDEADIIHFIQAVVFVDLKGNSKLTSWADSDCGDNDDD